MGGLGRIRGGAPLAGRGGVTFREQVSSCVVNARVEPGGCSCGEETQTECPGLTFWPSAYLLLFFPSQFRF